MAELRASHHQQRKIDRWLALSAKLQTLESNYDFYRKNGQEKYAKKVLKPQIIKLNNEITDLRIEIEADHDRAAKYLLRCFVVGDIGSEVADDFAAVMQDVSLGKEDQNDNAFCELMRLQSNEWNKVVQLVDGGTFEVSMYYADMAEEICTEVKRVMDEIIDKYMSTHKGKRLF